jgi:predicted DNA-binding ribbon-helix-helix protein
MPTRNPRVNVVLEKPLYDTVRRLAAKEEISLSMKISDLIKQALEAEEDAVLAEFAEEREKTFRRSRGMSHKQVWGS